MLIDDSNRVLYDLFGQGIAVRVQVHLPQMVAQLIEQAFAQVTTGYTRRIELADNLERFMQIGECESQIDIGMAV